MPRASLAFSAVAKPVLVASLALNLLPGEINVSPNHDTRK
jgi:hypothetical protein